jgi:hypothetical protein
MDPAVFKTRRQVLCISAACGWPAAEVEVGQTRHGDDAQPADDKPALFPKVAHGEQHDRVRREPKDLKILDEHGKPLLSGDHVRRFFSLVDAQVQGQLLLLVSTGDTHTISYAWASRRRSFTWKGVILQPVLGWTNHHSIVEVDGKWQYSITTRSVRMV